MKIAVILIVLGIAIKWFMSYVIRIEREATRKACEEAYEDGKRFADFVKTTKYPITSDAAWGLYLKHKKERENEGTKEAS